MTPGERYRPAGHPSPGPPSRVPVSLLTVGLFVDFPVYRGAKHSYECTTGRYTVRNPRKGPIVAATSAGPAAKRLVVLVSGSGTNLQALLDEIAAVGAEAYGARIVAVGADRDGIEGWPAPSAPGSPPSCGR